MATFERYFIDDKTPWKETNNSYYKLRENPEICGKILKNFGLDPEKGIIVNGHTPVKVVKGETPVKAGGRSSSLCVCIVEVEGLLFYRLYSAMDLLVPL